MRLFPALAAAAILAGPAVQAQDSDRPREFAEFRGTWVREPSAPGDSVGSSYYVGRTLVVATTPTEISITKDSKLTETYRFDGIETQAKEPRTGALLDPRHSFRLVAGMLALTTRTTSSPGAAGLRTTAILTDAYSLPEFNILRVERQISVLQEPPGHLRTLGLRNSTETYVYRRAPDPK